MEYNDLIEHYQSLQTDIRELREDIEATKESMEHLRTYMGILETHQWFSEDCAAADLYIAHEDDPNHQEEKETE